MATRRASTALAWLITAAGQYGDFFCNGCIVTDGSFGRGPQARVLRQLLARIGLAKQGMDQRGQRGLLLSLLALAVLVQHAPRAACLEVRATYATHPHTA